MDAGWWDVWPACAMSGLIKSHRLGSVDRLAWLSSSDMSYNLSLAANFKLLYKSKQSNGVTLQSL